VQNLYEILGIKKDATKAEIKRSYRFLSKSAHPDTGGSQEAFTKLRTAYTVLSDEEMRKHYDATGEYNEQAVHTHEEKVTATIVMAFTQMLQAGFAQRKDIDVIKQLREAVAKQIDELSVQIKNNKIMMDDFLNLKNRISREDDKPNIFTSTLDQRLRQLENNKINMDDGLKVLNSTMEELKLYKSLVTMTQARQIWVVTDSTGATIG